MHIRKRSCLLVSECRDSLRATTTEQQHHHQLIIHVNYMCIVLKFAQAINKSVGRGFISCFTFAI